MKHLIILFALFAFNTLFLNTAQASYKFLQGQFTLSGALKNKSTYPEIITPVFKIQGSALWTIDEGNYGRATAQITVQRTTYECDYVFSYTKDYTCEISGAKFQQMLNEAVIHNDTFLEAQALIKRYYDKAYSSERFEIVLGRLNQNFEGTDNSELRDPSNVNRSVVFEITNTGMHDL